MITLILTFKQAKFLLEHIPEGHSISLTVGDANRILDYDKLSKKYNEDNSGGTQSISSQLTSNNQLQPINQPQSANNTGFNVSERINSRKR